MNWGKKTEEKRDREGKKVTHHFAPKTLGLEQIWSHTSGKRESLFPTLFRFVRPDPPLLALSGPVPPLPTSESSLTFTKSWPQCGQGSRKGRALMKFTQASYTSVVGSIG